MATNKAIKTALLAKLGVTPQRLSQLAQRRKRELPMTTEQAVYTLAHEHGIDVSTDLSKEETTEVRALVTQLASARKADAQRASSTPRRTESKRTGAKPVVVTIAGVKLPDIPALKPSHAAEAKVMAERVYPTLYFFENSVRDLIERVLGAAFGANWWTTAVPAAVQKTAIKHIEDEKRDPWHSKRGRREIDYVFLNDLWAIIKHQWAHFKDLFPNQAWVETLITSDMNVSRRVLAHMNPLETDDITNIENAFRKWAKQLRAVKDRLP